MNEIEAFYNKFNEDKRLKTRHGTVEYEVTMHYINKYIDSISPEVITDIGCASGAYTIPLLDRAGKVIAIDIVRYNLGRLRQNADKVDSNLRERLTCYKRNAMKLRDIEDDISDVTLMLGPMYHLDTLTKRRKALSEAIRITKSGGVILVGYIMNEYAVIMHGFYEHTILDDISEGNVDVNNDYKIDNTDNVYSFVRLEDIDEINEDMSVYRDTIFSPDGLCNYHRPMLNSLSEEEFREFIRYQVAISRRKELLGYSTHIVDVLRVKK